MLVKKINYQLYLLLSSYVWGLIWLEKKTDQRKQPKKIKKHQQKQAVLRAKLSRKKKECKNRIVYICIAFRYKVHIHLIYHMILFIKL